MKVILTLYTGEVREFVTTNNSFVIGRSSTSDIKIEMDGISRQHCRIEIDDLGDIYITDLNSTNGVLIDGQKIEPGKRVLYNTFLTLSMGPIQSFQFESDEKTTFKTIPKKIHTQPKIPKQNTQASTSPSIHKSLSASKKTKKDGGGHSIQGWGILVSILIVAGLLYTYHLVRFDKPEAPLPLSKDFLRFE